MSVKKIVISPNNTMAMAFFNDLDKRKEEMLKKVEESVVLKRATKVLIKKVSK